MNNKVKREWYTCAINERVKQRKRLEAGKEGKKKRERERESSKHGYNTMLIYMYIKSDQHGIWPFHCAGFL